MAQGDFDDVLNILGLGKWNLLYYLHIGIAAFMLPGFFLAGGFITPSVEFDCDTQNIDGTIQDQDQCTYTVLENTTLGEESEMERKCSEWIYNGTYFTNTLTSEFDLVCDDAYLRPTFQTIFMLGSLIGSPMNGFLSDRYGRKTLLSYTSVISIWSLLISTIAPNFMTMLFSRFLTGMTTSAIYHTGFILCMEVCEPKHRTAVGILVGLPWSFGTIWWGVLGYLIKDWRWLMRATTVPAIMYFTLLCFLDESPRWLIVSGYYTRALVSLKKAAQWNHCTLPPDDELLERMVDIQKSSGGEDEPEKKVKTSPSFGSRVKGGIRQITILYKTPEICKRTLLMYAVFIVCSTVFYGLTLNAVNFQLDPFMYMVVSGLTEIPAYSVTVPIVMKFGRIPPTATCYFICGLTILTLAFIPSDPKWLIISLAMIGRFCICAAYEILFLIASEVFPTEVRAQGIGTSSFVSNIGGIAAPFVTDLIGSRYPWVPPIIFGGLSLLAGVASIFIPETLNKHLPETVLQLEKDVKYKKNRRNKEENETFEIIVNNSSP